MAHDVFISHSAQDKIAADSVCSALEARGIRCWIAPRDILPGETWPAAIVRGIRSTRIFVLVFSRHANVSAPVQQEVAQAADLRKHIICYRIEDVQRNDIEDELKFFLNTRHWLDAITPPLDAHLDKLVNACTSVIALDGNYESSARGSERMRAVTPQLIRTSPLSEQISYQPAGPPPLPSQWESQQPGRTTSTDSRSIKIKAVVAVVVLAVGGFLGVKLFGAGSDGGSPPGTSSEDSAAAGPDVDQIKQLVKAWDNDLNNHDLSGLQSLMCSGSDSQLPRDIFATRDNVGGTLSSDVSNIRVTGDRATASVTNNWAGGSHSRFENAYAKENGVWKICHTLSF